MKIRRFFMRGFLMLCLSAVLLGAGVAGASAEEPGSVPGASTDPNPIPSTDPSPEPSADPVPEPSVDPNPEPSADPNPTPGAKPEPSVDPNPTPSAKPEPTESPSPTPTPDPRIQCGPNAWGLLTDTGNLIISGSGDMWNYAASGQSVFNSIKNKIQVITVEDGITSIGDYAFENTTCSQVNIGKGVKYIGRRAFRASNNLTGVTIPGNVEWVGPGAFRESAKLVSCVLSQGIARIGKYAFYETPLRAVEIPEGVKWIYRRAFEKTAVTRVTIPFSVELVDDYAFGKVSALIYTPNAKFTHPAFAAGSTLTVRRGSTAEAYANTYKTKDSLQVRYLECEPSGSFPLENHSWDGGKITKAATCAMEGVKQYTCTQCGATKTEAIPRADHSFGEWKTLAAATVSEKGLEGRQCSVCGYMETKDLSKLKPVVGLNIEKLTLNAGGTYKLKVIRKSAGDSVASWSSSNKTVAKVSSAGKVTAKAPGTASITVKMESGVSAKVKLTVRKVATTKLTVSAKGAKLKSKKISVKAKKTFTLVPKVKPANATDKVKFSSSKKSVATVNSSGKVTAKKKGKTKITIKSGKKKVTITVTVK